MPSGLCWVGFYHLWNHSWYPPCCYEAALTSLPTLCSCPTSKICVIHLKSWYGKVIYAQFEGWLSLFIPFSPLSWTQSHPHPFFHTHPLTHLQGLKSSPDSKLAFTYPPKSKPTFHEITVHYFSCKSLTSWSCWHSGHKTSSYHFSMLCVRCWAPVSHTAPNLCTELNMNYSLWDAHRRRNWEFCKQNHFLDIPTYH